MAWKVLLITEDEELTAKAQAELPEEDGHRVSTITPSKLGKRTTLPIQPDWLVVDTLALDGLLLNGVLERIRRSSSLIQERTVAIQTPGGPIVDNRIRAKAYIPRTSSLAEVIESLAEHLKTTWTKR